MKRILFVFILHLMITQIRAQQVISAAGATASGTGVQLSWTIGEPVIETFTGATAILTQGFHQSRLFATAIDPIENPGLKLTVYPNPVSGILKLEITDHRLEGIRYSLFTMDGKSILDRKVEKQPELISMENYTPGTYLLKIFVSGNHPVQTFKIVKN